MCDVCMQCTGWLCKQPVGRAGLDHSNALTSGWKIRFFCLGNDALSYYTYRPKEHRLKLKGAIPVMAGCLCCILLGVVIGRVLGGLMDWLLALSLMFSRFCERLVEGLCPGCGD